MSHDLRCERSATSPKRCRCRDCEGRLHGVQAVRQRVLGDEGPIDFRRLGREIATALRDNPPTTELP
jgi:ribosomal protein L34E